MSQKEEINKKLIKPLAITAGILGLIQGIAWILFSVLCICCYYDVIALNNVSITTVGDHYTSYIYYIFLNSKFPIVSTVVTGVIINPDEFFIFTWFYLVFSAVWTIVSGCVTWGMIHNQWHLAKCYFSLWSTTTILISLVDVILTSLIGHDYQLVNDSNRFPTTVLVSYGIVMSLAARGYILWIVNIVFASVMIKFTVDIVSSQKNGPGIPIINGYDTNNANTPWSNNSQMDLWPNLQQERPHNIDGYNNNSFEQNDYFSSPYKLNNFQNSDPYNLPVSPKEGNTFAESIANKVATIGKNKGKRSPPTNIRSPVIPEPDYTPPGSPNALKSVLRSRSNYS